MDCSLAFILFHLLLLVTELLQVFQNERAVCGDTPQRRAFVYLRTVGTGIQSLFPDTVMYGAELVAERRFYAFHAAAGAVDHVRGDCYPVELRPQGCGFLAQSIVVCERCDSGVTRFTVQSAAANQCAYVFHRYLHKLRPAEDITPNGGMFFCCHQLLGKLALLFIFITYFPLIFRKRSCQEQGIDNRNSDQNSDMKQVHFHGKICVVCKRAERVDRRMDDDVVSVSMAYLQTVYYKSDWSDASGLPAHITVECEPFLWRDELPHRWNMCRFRIYLR